LCEGPVAGITNAYINKSVVTPSSLFSLFLGTYPQTPWSYLTSSHAAQAIGYQGIAYVAAASYDLGNSSALPNHSFEVAGKLILSGTSDADPRDVLNDLMTSQVYGVPNAPVLSGLTQYSNYCRAAGLLISPCYDTQVAAAQMVTELMQITNTGVYFSEGALKLVPYGDATLTGNGATYTPVLTVQANFGDDDFLTNGGADPVIVRRNAIAATVSTTADAFNQVTIEYLDRANAYNPATVVVQDQAAIDVYGLRAMSVITAHQIASAAVANTVAMLILQRAVYVRSQYEFRLGWQWCFLEPTDLVTITDAGLGLNLYPVRILSIEEDESGTLTVLAEDAPPGVGSHVTANVPVNGGYNVNQATVPGDTNTPVIFEAPNALTAPDLQLWVAASGGANWGGCNVWASSDGSTYRLIGTINGPARHGLLTNLVPAGSDPDTSHTLAVDMSACRGQLIAGTSADADSGNTMLWVDGELISYSAATLTSAYHYNLGTYLRRGQKGSANATHAIGAQFARLDDGIFKYSVPTDRIGSPIYLKFPSFNIWGESTQSLASVAAYSHTFTGNKPSPLASLSAVGGMFEIVVNWTFNSGQIDRDFIEVWGNTTNDRSSAFLLSSVKNPAQNWAHPGLVPGQTWYYWARVVDTSGNDSDFYPLGATAGIAAAPSADPSALLTQLNKSLGLGQLVADLAGPIAVMSGATSSNAIASLQSALSDYDLTNRMLWQESVTNATVTIDPLTGKISLLATANVTTDISSRLTAVEVLANAENATLTSTVATLTTVQGNLTSTQAAVTILQGQITTTASTVYVDNSVAAATGAITTTSANAYTSLAAAELQSAIDAFTTGQAQQSLTGTVAFATASIKTNADALAAMSTSFSALVATVAGNLAAIVTEQTTRTTADTALANSISALTATVGANLATLTVEQTTRASADSALASSITALTATVAGNTSAISSEATTRASADSSLSTSISTVSASLGTTNANLATVSATATASASAITGLQAQYTLQVQTYTGGVLHVAGMQLASGSGTTSVIFLADKFALVAPDGSGAPKNLMSVGNINGASTFGFNGNAIIDGSILAQSIDTRGLTIRDATTGAVLFGAGTSLDHSLITPDAGWLNSNVTLSGLGAGPFASLTAITAANISTYINTAAISLAYINTASITNLAALSATMGALTIGSGGHIAQGQSNYNTGTGFWLGDNSGTPMMSIGASGGNSFTWDGTTLTVVGSINGTVVDTRNFTAGSVPICSDLSIGQLFSTGKTANTYYTVKSMYTPKGGVLTISFDYQRPQALGPTFQWSIFVNGSAVGSAPAPASSTGWVNLSQNITVTAGGTVEVRVQIQTSITNGYYGYVRHFVARNGFSTINQPSVTIGSYD
jgi:hypothetical protein